MTEEVKDINNKVFSTRLSSLENPNAKVLKQAMKHANNDKGNGSYPLLSNFPKLASTCNTTLPPKDFVRHHISTNDPPIYSASRRLSREI